MANNSRREFLQKWMAITGAAAASAAALTPPDTADAASQPTYETLTSASQSWAPVRAVDTEHMPWQRTALGDEKVLFTAREQKSRLSMVRLAPRHGGSPSHYHTAHEWAFHLAGDLVHCEYTSPDQRVGPFVRYKEGFFLDRPPYSLHGFENGRQLESQMGATLLFMSEGGGTVSPIPADPAYSEEYKEIKEWSRPRIVDTVEKMAWEPDPSVPGLQAKHLADDPGQGFRAVLRSLPAGWNSSESPDFVRAYYYKQACQFSFVLAGNLNIQAYRAPGEKAEKLALGKYSYLERAPRSIYGLADGVVSERSCVWLEVTYARGASTSDAPMEEPNRV